jgi:hypothetical protein
MLEAARNAGSSSAPSSHAIRPIQPPADHSWACRGAPPAPWAEDRFRSKEVSWCRERRLVGGAAWVTENSLWGRPGTYAGQTLGPWSGVPESSWVAPISRPI